MRRRRFLRLGVAGAALTAGCSGSSGTGDPTTGSPDGSTATRTAGSGTGSRDSDGGGRVYVQPFVEGMAAPGRATPGEYAVALLVTVPHRFWTVTGDDRAVVPRTDADAVHLMAVVWDPESGRVLPETGLSVEITRDGALVSEEVVYPMLSQRMGVHYGGNFELDGDGTYAVAVSVGGTGIRRTGAFRGRFADPATGRVAFTLDDALRRRIDTRDVPQAGDPGAVAPMETDFPLGRAPAESALPGEVRGTASTGDARLVVTVLEDPPAGVDGEGPYLAVSARTPYNRLVLPAMALSGELTRDGTGVFAGRLERTLDPELYYHYGAALGPDASVEAGDTLRLTVDTPPQIARHEGYETAFLEMPPATVAL